MERMCYYCLLFFLGVVFKEEWGLGRRGPQAMRGGHPAQDTGQIGGRNFQVLPSDKNEPMTSM